MPRIRPAILLAAAMALALCAASGRAGADPGDELTVTVLTFGPGDDPFDKFGHDAIWIHDASDEEDYVYNYGTFSFGSKSTILKFFVGRFTYWLSRGHLSSTMRSYGRENRTIDAQELALSAAQKKALFDRLEENRKPENKYYKYDYYRDNCSTRVRDILDELTGGRVRAVSGGPASMTYRAHTLRLTADYLPEYLILDLVMGDLIDRPITEWDEAFLPGKLQETLRKVTIPGPGGEVPLVRSERRMLEARREPPPAAPPSRTGWMALVGALAGGALAALGRAAPRRPAARVGFGGALALFGLVVGFFGWFFLAAWALTDHEVGYRNQNLFLCAPWAIALAGMGIGVARGRLASIRRARALVLAGLAAALLGALVKLQPWLVQDNARMLALLLPVWTGAAIGAAGLTRPRGEPAARAADDAGTRSGSPRGAA